MKKKVHRLSAGTTAVMIAASALMLPPMTAQAASGIVINEVCTKNTTQPASDGAFYDYVELYNTGSSPVSLKGWALSDDAANPKAYELPADATIPANGFYTVWFDVPEGMTGTSFGLSKKGETVILTDPNGNTAETLGVPALADDTAYGRVPDGSETFAILNALSPGKSNPSDATGDVVVRVPEFSKESGFYSDGFQLSLSVPSGCTIYYTTDGSDPTTSSQKYTGEIRVYDRSDEENVYAAITGIGSSYVAPTDPVDKAMIVRAISVDEKGNVSKIATKTYFIGYTNNDFITNMPVISLVTDPDNLFDADKGIYVIGNHGGAQGAGGMWAMGKEEGNFTQSGKEWERPANFTYFDENGDPVVSTDVGIRIHGGWTRACAQKSFNIYTRAEYGSTKIKYDFFNGQVKDINGKTIKSFDKLTLRNGGNDEKTKIRDRLNQEMVPDRTFGTLAQTECVVFLDGEFWGTYNLMEKIGSEYLSDHYDVKEKDVCMIKTDELADGSDAGWADYEQLKQFALSGQQNEAISFAEASKLIDLQSFADYMAAELIIGNDDFGENNYALWKTEKVDETRQYADGLWRFILFDTEYGQGLYGQSNANTSILNKLQQYSQQGKWLPRLFFRLMQDDDFRTLFVRNYCDQLNKNFKADTVTARLNELIKIYEKSVPATIERFNWNSSSTGMGDWTMPGMGDWNIGDWGNWGQNPGQQDPNNPGQGDAGNSDGQQNPWQNPGGQNPWGPGQQDPQNPGGQNPQNPGGQTPGQEQTKKTGSEVFTSNVSPITTFWQSRETTARQILTQYLGNKVSQQTITAKINASECDVQFNTIQLGKSGFSGTYFQSEPIFVKVIAPDGNHPDEPSVTGGTVTGGNALDGYIITPDENASTVEITVKYSAGSIQQPETTKPVVTTAPKTNGLRGDVNTDGSVNVSDAVLLSRVLAEDTTANITDLGKANADTNGDGNMTPEDNTLILKFLAGLVDL